jgi:hypothetical protein
MMVPKGRRAPLTGMRSPTRPVEPSPTENDDDEGDDENGFERHGDLLGRWERSGMCERLSHSLASARAMPAVPYARLGRDPWIIGSNGAADTHGGVPLAPEEFLREALQVSVSGTGRRVKAAPRKS